LFSTFRDVTIAGGGVHVAPGARLHIDGAFAVTDGDLRVDGWLELMQPITADVGGDLTLSDDATIRWRIDALPTPVPLLSVGGIATLDGLMDVFLPGSPYAPPRPAWYPILLGPNYEGRFDALRFYPNGPDQRARLYYLDEGVFVVISPAPGVIAPLVGVVGAIGPRRRRSVAA